MGTRVPEKGMFSALEGGRSNSGGRWKGNDGEKP